MIVFFLLQTIEYMIPLTLGNEYLTRPTWICYSDNAKELPQVKAFLDIIKNKY